ncbi:MAG: sodium:proton antiporter, partial [Clostridia bacterium]|nr:sodium:proton antiporter [Clostridia bacterium]
MKKSAKSAIIWVAVIIFSYLLAMVTPSAEEGLGIFSIIPSVFLIVSIFATKRILESLTLSIVMGIILVDGSDLLGTFTDLMLDTLAGEDIPWIFLVGGLMGVIIALIEYSGGAMAFAKWMASKAKSREAIMFCTWVVGLVVFVDDYLSALVVGSCMKPLSDEKKISREMLSFIVDSTASPSCVLIPMSTWGVFVAGLLESCGWAPEGEGLSYYIKTI